MNLKVVWRKPLSLRKCADGANQIYELDLAQIPNKAGVYMFMRTFGKRRIPLYIGKAGNLNSRIKQQLNTLHLMKGIENASAGSRSLVIGQFVPKQAQVPEKCIHLIEAALIRYYLSEGWDLLNKSGTRLSKHSLHSETITAKFVPKTILF